MSDAIGRPIKEKTRFDGIIDELIKIREEELLLSYQFGAEKIKDLAIKGYSELYHKFLKVRAALEISRGQWINSVNEKQCLEALEQTKTPPDTEKGE